MKKAFLVVLTFVIMQVVVPTVGTYLLGAHALGNGNVSELSGQITNPYALCIMMIAAYALTVGALYAWRLLLPDTKLVRRKTPIALAIAVTLAVLVPMSFLEELLELPDKLSNASYIIASNPLGIFCVVVVGPIVEELVFRRATLGAMLESGTKAPMAIIVSALAFALVHFNPAQAPAAIVLGCLFGWIYVRSGSIIPSIVCHIFNNALSVCLMLGIGDDVTMSTLCGSRLTAAAVSLVFAALAVTLIKVYARKTAGKILKNEN